MSDTNLFNSCTYNINGEKWGKMPSKPFSQKCYIKFLSKYNCKNRHSLKLYYANHHTYTVAITLCKPANKYNQFIAIGNLQH